MVKNLYFALFIALSSMLWVCNLKSETIWLQDDTTMVGDIQGSSGGKLQLNTDYAGVVQVELGSIFSATTDKDVYVAFDDGTILFGRLLVDKGKPMVRTSEGTSLVGNRKITAIWLVGQNNPLVSNKEVRQWHYEATADVVGKTGNSDKIATSGSLKATLETPDDRLVMYLRGARSKDDGNKTVEEIKGGMDYESFFSAPHSWYTRFELEKDKIEGIDLRAIASIGYGYYFIKEDWHELRCRLGFEVRHESFDEPLENGSDSETSPALDINIYHLYHINDWAKLISQVDYSPSLEESDNYRIYHESSLDIPLVRSKVWSIRFGISNEYNNVVAKNRRHLDTTYFSRLVLVWE